MKETLDEIRTMVESLRSGHYDCEDCWYSCPKSDHCCDDTAGDECNCGADDQNKIIDEIIAKIDTLKKGG